MQSYRPSERSSYNTEDIRHIRHIRQEIHDDYERLIKMYRRLAETRSTMSEHEIREQERKINYLKSTIENRQNDIGWRPPSMGANRMGRQSEAAGDLEEQLERLKLGMEQLMENQQWSKAQKAKLGERINQRILARSQYGQKDRGQDRAYTRLDEVTEDEWPYQESYQGQSQHRGRPRQQRPTTSSGPASSRRQHSVSSTSSRSASATRNDQALVLASSAMVRHTEVPPLQPPEPETLPSGMYLIYAATFRRSAGERQYELVTFLYMRTKTTWGSYMFTGEGSMYVHRQDRKGNRQILRIDEVDPFTWVESETQPRDIYKSHSTRCLGVYRAAEDKGEEWALNNLLPSAVEYYEQAQLRGTRGVDQQFVQTLRKLPPNSIAWTREGRKVIDNEEYNPPKLSRGTQQHTQQQQAQAYMFRPGAQRLRKRNPDDKVEILNR